MLQIDFVIIYYSNDLQFLRLAPFFLVGNKDLGVKLWHATTNNRCPQVNTHHILGL